MKQCTVRVILFLSFLGLFSIISSSCTLNPEPPPFSYGAVDLSISTDNNGIQTILLQISLQNRGTAEISQIDISFRLYDLDGNTQPPVGRNYFEVPLAVSIAAGANALLEVDLHDLFYHPLQNGLQVVALCVDKVSYIDGSSWSDSARLYQYPDAVHSVEE